MLKLGHASRMTMAETFEAGGNLGRWLLPYDIAIDGMTLTEVGRQAANGVNPFRVQRADLSW